MFGQHCFDDATYNGGRLGYGFAPAYIAPIVGATARKGTGSRTPVAYTKPIAANAQRMGRGARAVISHLSSVAALALRAGRGARKPVSHVLQIISHMRLPQVNLKVSYLERQVKVEVEE